MTVKGSDLHLLWTNTAGHERKLVLRKCLPLSGHSRYVETPQN